MKTMNEQDKNQMLQAIIEEGENYQAKMWGTLMVDARTLVRLNVLSGGNGALGALSNEYCYVGVTENTIYFVVVGSINVSILNR